MGFYFGIFGVLAFFSLVELFGLKRNQRNILFVLFSLGMFCISFLRWEVGTDWEAYIVFFDQSVDWFADSEFEWGFARLNELAHIVFGNYSVLLFILGAILFGFQTTAIYKLSPYPVTSLLFLWSVSFGNAMFVRQSIATAILFFSITYIINRKFWKFLLLVGLAMLFHRTSFIFIPAWWIYRMQIKPLWLWIGIGISVMLTAGLKIAIESVAGAFGPIVQAKLDTYLSDSETTFGTAASLTQIIVKGVANKVFVFWGLILMYKKITATSPSYKGLVQLYWFGILLYFSTIGISVALVRLSFAYDILQVILVPTLIQYIEDKSFKTIAYTIFVSYLLLRLYISLIGNYFDMFVPFKTILSQ